jgi:4'-phosphopantetheinyl transferase
MCVDNPRVFQAPPLLSARDIHCWYVPLTWAPADLEMFSALLSPDEAARAQQYRFDVHRRRFIVRHAALRMILATYSDIPPQALRFRVNQYGKPALERTMPHSPLIFNLSHSDDLAVVAVSGVAELGVDIEHLRPMPDLQAIATRFFSPREQTTLLKLPQPDRLRAFYRCWTGKEAFIKALGMGLQFDLRRFDVSVAPDVPPALLRIDDDYDCGRQWAVAALAPAAHYIGTVVSAPPLERILTYRWRGLHSVPS